MKYFFKPDWFIIISTLLVVCGVAMLISILHWDTILSLFFLIMMVGILVYGLAVIPIWTEVNDNLVKVQQVVGVRKFKRATSKITPIDREDLEGAFRIFGSGGYGGYTGWFRNHKLGKFFMLIINKKELALVETEKGKKYVINYPHKLLNK